MLLHDLYVILVNLPFVEMNILRAISNCSHCLWLLWAKTAKPSSCNRDLMIQNTQNICHLAFYRQKVY